MNLTNASAIVTGGAGGFGSATVRRLAQKGAKALTVRATRSATFENTVYAKFAEFPLVELRRTNLPRPPVNKGFSLTRIVFERLVPLLRHRPRKAS